MDVNPMKGGLNNLTFTGEEVPNKNCFWIMGLRPVIIYIFGVQRYSFFLRWAIFSLDNTHD